MPDPHDQIYAQIKKDIAGVAGKAMPEPLPAMRSAVLPVGAVTPADVEATQATFQSDYGQFVQRLAGGPPRRIDISVERDPVILGEYFMPEGEGTNVLNLQTMRLRIDPTKGPSSRVMAHEMGHALDERFWNEMLRIGIGATPPGALTLREAQATEQKMARERYGVPVGVTTDTIPVLDEMFELYRAGMHPQRAYGLAGPSNEYRAQTFEEAARYLWATRERTPEQFQQGLELLGEQRPGIVTMVEFLGEHRGPIFEAMGHPVTGEKEPGLLTRVVRTVGDIVRQRGPQYETSRWSTPKEVAAHEQWEGKTRAWRERRDLIGEAMRSKGGK